MSDLTAAVEAAELRMWPAHQEPDELIAARFRAAVIAACEEIEAAARAVERTKTAQDIARAIEAEYQRTDVMVIAGWGDGMASAAAIARQHANGMPRADATGRTGADTSDATPDAPKAAQTLSDGSKPCGCVGKCPSLFKPCPICDAEVTAVAVDGALATTYRPCGHVVPDDGSGR